MTTNDGRVWKMGKERPPRNPILNEKTPRRNFIGWEFAPPEKPPENPRWAEPEHARSILDMLPSQQAKIQSEIKWKQESEERIRKFEESIRQEKLLQKSMSTNGIGNSARESDRAGMEDRTFEEEGRGHSTGRSGYDNTISTGHLSTGREQSSTDRLMAIPVSHIKSLQKTCPAVLTRYRAQRAQDFIKHSTDTDPRAPRPKEEEQRISFRPAGNLTRHVPQDHDPQSSSTKKGQKKTMQVKPRKPAALAPLPASESDLLAELKQLTSALEITNEEIERQTLKMALRKKTKSYEKKSS